MLRRILAALLALAGVVIGSGAVASATWWRPAATVTASTATAALATSNVLVSLPGTLTQGGEKARLVVSAGPADEVAVVIAPTSDVASFLGTDQFQLVTGLTSSWEVLHTEPATIARLQGLLDASEGTPSPSAQSGSSASASASASDGASASATPSASPAPAGGEQSAPASDAATSPSEASANPSAAPTQAAGWTGVPAGTPPAFLDPRGRDLWTTVTGTGSVEINWERQVGRWSLLAANLAQGAQTPPTLSITWQREVGTPFLIPGVVLGTILLLVGLAWFAFEQWKINSLTARPARGRRASAVLPLDRHQEGSSGTAADASDQVTDKPGKADPAGEPDPADPAGEPDLADPANPITGTLPVVQVPVAEVPVADGPPATTTPQRDPSAEESAWRKAWGIKEDRT